MGNSRINMVDLVHYFLFLTGSTPKRPITSRTRVVTPDGQCGPWWIWDGENEEMLERELTPSEMRYSLRGIISAPLLLERIEQGYRPEIHDV